MRTFVFTIRVRDQFIGIRDDTGPWEVNFTVYPYDEEYESPDTSKTMLSGFVNWQNGITIYGVEQIQPSEFAGIMACAGEAIEAAKVAMGENWKLGGL